LEASPPICCSVLRLRIGRRLQRRDLGPDLFTVTRKGRAADNESKSVRDHVLAIEWFARMRVVDVRPRDCFKVVEELRAKGGLGEKYISNIWSVARGGFQHAKFEELRVDNPAELPKGTIKRSKIKKRFPYHRQEIRQLIGCAGVSLPMQVFILMLVYSGMRKGEACGRRWRHYATNSQPLGALLVDTQYDDRPLKGDDEELVRPRVVPVHPRLARKLTWWWNEGFELFYLRKPTLDASSCPLAGPW
jgi:integrase